MIIEFYNEKEIKKYIKCRQGETVKTLMLYSLTIITVFNFSSFNSVFMWFYIFTVLYCGLYMC